MKAQRRIKKARIEYISLCPKGKNKMPVLYKEDDGKGMVEFDTLLHKSPNFEDDGELTAIVYAVEQPDTDGDVASAEVIKEMAYDFQKRGGDIDLRHNGKPLGKDQAFIAENFIIQKGDHRFSDLHDYNGDPVDATDAWGVVIKIDDPELRRLYREGEWQGVSMAGPALLEPERASKEYTMKPEELEQVLGKSNSTFVDSLKKAFEPVFGHFKKEEPVKKEEPEPKPKQVEEPAAPIFKGDPTDPKAVEAHLTALRNYKLEKELDWSDPEAVKEHLEALEKSNSNEDTKEEKSPEVLQLEKEVAERNRKINELKKASKQPVKDADEPEVFNDGLTKEERAGFELGRKMGQFVNGTLQTAK